MKIAMLGLRAIGQGSGGIERAVEEISTRLVSWGNDVTVFCRSRYNPERRREYHGVKLRNLPAIYTKHLEAISHSLLSLIVALRGFDVIHIHAIGPSLWSWLPRLFGKRVVVTVHGLDWKRQKWNGIAKAVLKCGQWSSAHFPHKTIVVSQGLKTYYEERYGKQVVYIPNGVPKTEQRPLAALKRFNVSPGKYVLFLGRLVPEKGVHTLVQAFQMVEGDVKLLIVGDATHTDNYVERLKAQAAHDPRIVFAGPLYGEEKDEAYSNAACLAMPSTIEGFPIVMLEAMGYGLPVVCSDIPENMELANAQEPPLATSCDRSSPHALAESLTMVLEHAEEAEATAARAKQFVRASFSWDAIARQTAETYAFISL